MTTTMRHIKYAGIKYKSVKLRDIYCYKGSPGDKWSNKKVLLLA